MLRDHEEYSIPITENALATAILFADDTTLLASSLENLERQLELVEEFCSYSGARLNPHKCKVLTLDSNHAVPPHPRLNLVPTGVPIRYLGIWLGHGLSDSAQVKVIEDKFYASFLKWGCRARTWRGRRLLVNTMILSQLWHYTMVLIIPPTTIAKWQSMVTKFVISRKTQATDRLISTMSSGLAYHRKVGLKIPHIASHIAKQRITRLQLLVQSDREPETLWTHLPKILWNRCVGNFNCPFFWDVLLIAPNIRTTLLQLEMMPPFW